MSANVTRRDFLGGAAAAVASVALPFGLKREDLEEVPVEPLEAEAPGFSKELAPEEVLVVLAELEDPEAGPKEVVLFPFRAGGGIREDVPPRRYRIGPNGPRLCFVPGDVRGVTIWAEPGVRVLVRADLGGGQWIECGGLET